MLRRLFTVFEVEMQSRTAVKFVPASGAASRMFKALFEFLVKNQKRYSGG